MAFQVETAAKLLRRSRDEGRLAHAYLVCGPQGSGKEQLVLEMIDLAGQRRGDSVEACRSDFVQVIRPEGKSRRIKVDAIREMEKRLHLCAPQSVTKVGIILDADRLGEEASNAFLKTLEEPPGRCLLILVTDQPEQLLQTILSRCLRVPLVGPGHLILGERETAFLTELHRHFTGGRKKGVGAVWALSQRFAECLREEKAGIAKDHEEEMKREREVYQKTTDGEWLKRREDFYESKTVASYLHRRAVLMELLIAWLGDALRSQSGIDKVEFPAFREGTEATGRMFSPAELLRRIEALEQLRNHLGTNVNEALALDVAFLDAFGS
jgi:DNA polymerase-3 subunit delta'